MNFDGKPFGLWMTSGEDGTDDRTCLITDQEAFLVAKRHVFEHLFNSDNEHKVVDAASHEMLGYQNAIFARINGEVHMVDPTHCRRTDGRLVFNTVALKDKFSEILGPQMSVLCQDGLADEVVRRKALQVLKAAVPSKFEVVDIERFNVNSQWIAYANSDGVDTYAMVLSKERMSAGLAWLGESPISVGPASVLTAIRDKVNNRPIDAQGPAAQGIKSTFGISEFEAVQVLEAWTAVISTNLCREILDAMNFPNPVDEQERHCDEFFVHAYVADHPEAVDYCHQRYPSLKQAKEVMSNVAERVKARAVASAPKR